MKTLKNHISSQHILTFLVTIMLVGFGIQYVSSFIEINSQIVFTDMALGLLVTIAFAKFVSERV